MKNKDRLLGRVGCFLLGFSLAAQHVYAATCSAELTETEKAGLVNHAEALVKTCPGESSREVWGRVTVFGWSHATPEELAAIYSDYESHSSFMLGVLRSEISETACALTKKVYFEINVPAVRNEKQFMWHVLSQAGDTYQIAFQLSGSSTFMNHIEGEMTLTPFQGGTLIAHRDVIIPGRMALKFGNAGTANLNLQRTVEQLMRHSDSQRGKVSGLIQQMHDALSTPACAIPQE